MKKINIIAALIISSASLSFAQTSSTPELKNQMDSLNYAFGVIYGGDVKQSEGEMTEENISQLIKGIDAGTKVKTEFPEMYLIGENVGKSLKQQSEANAFFGVEGLPVKLEIIKQGLINGMKNFEEQMTAADARNYFQTVMTEKRFSANLEAGKRFMEENGQKDGVVTTSTGLQYKVLKTGKGSKPQATDVVKVHYQGTLIDGNVFDSSIQRGEPAEFPVNQVISGWTEALQMMNVGSKWVLYIPQELAYGANGQGAIQPYSTLIFEVELLDIVK